MLDKHRILFANRIIEILYGILCMSHAFHQRTWWELRLEHVQSYHVDDEYPYGALKQVGFRSHEYDSAQALHLQSPSVRVGPSRLSRQIRLKFIHVE